jgi:hypothetical protein
MRFHPGDRVEKDDALIRFALTIFLSAFLLFQVQPLVSKRILPWFGGSPAVWTTCMLFFQLALLGGYVYAHLIATRLRGRRQVVVHLVVLGAAMMALPLLFLPLWLGGSWKPSSPDSPTWRIAGLLAATVGLPFFALSSTSPLVQRWFTLARPQGAVYRLYALSNVGSLLALLSFPVLMEPLLSTRTLAIAWAAGFAGFVLLCVWSGLGALRAGGVEQPVGAAQPPSAGDSLERQSQAMASAPPGAAAGSQPLEERVPRPVWLLWLLLPACASIMLLALTNAMCQDVAVVPFLWVLPLGLYLLSFIICFDSEYWYYRPVFWPLMLGAIWYMGEHVLRAGAEADLAVQIGGLAIGLFACAMVCHGELVRLRPGPRRLTAFYLMVAAGGALGGVFVTLAAPLVFKTFVELHIGIGLTAAVTLSALGYHLLYRTPAAWWARPIRGLPAWLRWTGVSLAAAGLVALAGWLTHLARTEQQEVVCTERNFYGVLRVLEYHPEDPEQHAFWLLHGRITHGVQYTGSLRRTPVSYYGKETGLALALNDYLRTENGMHVWAIGMGTATLAAYGRHGDLYRFFEINSNVVDLTKNKGYFTYFTDSPAQCEIVMGDGRLSIEREPPDQRFDVLVLDAFTSDAIPVHLLTREAFEIYLRHMNPGGIIAVHISNRHLDLEPVVVGLADEFGLKRVRRESGSSAEDTEFTTDWILLTNNEAFLAKPEVRENAAPLPARPCYWTDDFSDLFTIIRWRH